MQPTASSTCIAWALFSAASRARSCIGHSTPSHRSRFPCCLRSGANPFTARAMMPYSPKPPTSSSRRPCGLSRTHRIALGGIDLIPDLSGALYVPDFATLIVADLHLEKASSLARRGVHLPPYDTRETLAPLADAIAAT